MINRLRRKSESEDSEAAKSANSSPNIVQQMRVKASGFFHLALNIVLPVALLLLVEADLVEFAFILLLASKWRIFAVKPRHWLTNLRANAVDITVKLASFSFIVTAEDISTAIIWTMWYIIWLIGVKPRSESAWIGLQAGVAQFLGLSAMLQYSDTLSTEVQLLGVFIIASSAARHILTNYEEQMAGGLATLWGLFALQLAWVLDRWTLVYFIVPQIAILTTIIGYTLASIYDMQKNEALRPQILRQHVTLACTIVVLVLALANWTG